MEEEEKKNLWDARSGLRTGLGLGFEVGANTLLDIFSFEPTSQVAGGTFINYLAQKIRGGEISKGELAAAGLTSLIPGGAQARALTRGGQFTRSVVKGGIAGGITSTSVSLLDENELPSFGELAGGVGVGGAFGGMFDLAPATLKGKLGTDVSHITDDTIAFTKALKHKISTGKGIIPDMILEGGVMDIGAGGFGRSTLKQSPTPGDGGGGNFVDDAYTQKFVPQPWEAYQSPNPATARTLDTLLTKKTGFGAKLDAPQPKGKEYKIMRSKGPGRDPAPMVKEDIDLRKKPYKFNTAEQAVQSAKTFRQKIIRLMQIDRIRGEDAGTKTGFLKTSSKVNTVTGGVKDISETYFDYLTGYFNRYIRRGTVENFDDAIKLTIPKVKKGKVFPDEIDTIQGSSSLVRELRLFTIAPDVYKSGAFRANSYQDEIKNLIRKYSTAQKPKTYNKRRKVFEYRFDAHHIDQIAEGWPLYRGLPKEQIPEMRKLLQRYGLDPGNATGNRLLILNEFHKDYHNIYWPKAYAKLLKQGWDPDAMRTLQTAKEREVYVAMYVKAINESREKVLKAIDDNMDELLAALRQRRVDRVNDEISQIDIDFENVGDTIPQNILEQMLEEEAGTSPVNMNRNYQRPEDYE